MAQPAYQRIKVLSSGSLKDNTSSNSIKEETRMFDSNCADSSSNDTVSRNQPATSAWGIGWQTPTLMIVSYFSALIIAVIHFVLLHHLDGKSPDGPGLLPQSYISTFSIVLATVFQMTLQFSLGVAFVQYLWYLLRTSALRISTIEALFSIRSSPFTIFQVLRSAPTLGCLAILIWTIYFATSFPPGAITIESKAHANATLMTIPTFNGSFIGNESGVDANRFSLDELQNIYTSPTDSSGFLSSDLVRLGTVSPFLQQMANKILISGAPNPIPSHCGPNCSYTVVFDGPWLDCTDSLTNITVTDVQYTNGIPNTTAFDAYWTNAAEDPDQKLLSFPSSWDLPPNMSFTAITYEPRNDDWLLTQHNLTCAPSRASYTLWNSYENNIQSMILSGVSKGQLSDVYQNNNATPGGVVVPNITVGGLNDSSFATGAAEWSDDSLAWYRDHNLMNLVAASTLSLIGSFVVQQYVPLDLNSMNATSFGWCEPPSASGYGPNNGTLVANSGFINTIAPGNSNLGCNDNSSPLVSFAVTEDMLNSLLMNVTLTAITTYGYWNTTTNVTRNSFINIYSFSKPINLIVPYSLSLLLALPFILLGLWALHRNGVPAIDGGFIQLISTSTGSTELRRQAAMGCLGGKDNIPPALRNLKVRFGELKSKTGDESGGTGQVRRAGFGTEEEIVPLVKGAHYGMLDGSEELTEWI